MYEPIRAAMEYLLARCDGARTLDGQGYSRHDRPFAEDLLSKASWSPRQAAACYKLITRYRKQLSAGGIDITQIEIPREEPAPAGGVLCRRCQKPGRVTRQVEGNFQHSSPTDHEMCLGQVRQASARTVISLAWDSTPSVVGFRFPRNDDMAATLKSLLRARWQPSVTAWSVLVSSQADLEKVKTVAREHGFSWQATEVDQAIKNIAEANREASRAKDATIEIPNLGVTLRPFQKAGVAFAIRNRRVIIGDDMGTGKTIQALATLEKVEAYPAVVVCPASVKYNWAAEVKRMLPHRSVCVLDGSETLGIQAEITIINYDILGKFVEQLRSAEPVAVIVDESHRVKNHKAQRTQHVKNLVQGAPIRLLLTGTPIKNRAGELISQLDILGRLNDFGGFWSFAHNYCNAKQTRFGWVFDDWTCEDCEGRQSCDRCVAHRDAALEKLNGALRETCMIRRTKDEIMAELPAKTRTTIQVEITNRGAYNKAERVTLRELADEMTIADKALAKMLAAMTESARRSEILRRCREAKDLMKVSKLRNLAAEGKIEVAKEWINDFLESGEKLVIFAHHQKILDALTEAFPGAATIRGGDSAQARQDAVQRFQKDENCKLFIGALQAASEGITLTAASNVLFLELDWTPAALEQAEDRIHRIGQTKPANIWYMLAPNTVDDSMTELVESKRGIVKKVTA